MATETENIEKSDSFDFSIILRRIKRHWRLFAIVLPCFIALAMWKVHFADNEYDLEAQILIRDSDNKTIGSENLLEGMQIFSAYSNIQNELGVLKSYQLHLRTVKTLDFEASFYSNGKFKEKERYSSSPYKVTLNKSHPQLINRRFQIKQIDEWTYQLKITSENGLKLFNYETDEFLQLKDSSIVFEKEYKFGQEIHEDYFAFTIDYLPEQTDRYDDEKFSFVLNDYVKLANRYKSAIKLRTLNKEASIIVMNMTVQDKMKGINFMNALCQEYLKLGLEDKNKVASNTLKFINEQIDDIADSLSIAEYQLQNFRSKSKVMDLDFTSIKAFENLERYQKEKVELLTKDKYYKYLLDYVTTTALMDTLVAPSLMGINDQLLNNLLQELSALYKERAALGYNSESKNPALQRLNAKVNKTKSTLIENVNGLISASEIRLEELEKSVNRTMARVNELPETERNLINIERKFNLNDQLYKYLLQKRAEASIALASNISDHKILDEAQMLGTGPKATAGTLTYILFVILGLILPIAVVIVKGMIQGRISGELQTRKLAMMPYVGAIGVNKTATDLPLLKYPNSPISESFRVVKSNLEHQLSSLESKVMGVTSMTSREGKSFIAANLALTYALSGKKVLLISADLRKPDSHEMFGISNNIGLSTYINGAVSEELIVKRTLNENLNFIPSGSRTQYPAELLGSQTLHNLIAESKSKYDLIVIDGPPLGIVSDYFILTDQIDVHLFVTRDDFTTTTDLEKLNELHTSKRIVNCMLVFNYYKNALTHSRSIIQEYYEFTNRKSLREIIKRKLKLSI